MKGTRCAAALALGAAVVLLFACRSDDAGGTGAMIPDYVYAWGDRLQFVALERAVDPSGEVNVSLLGMDRAEPLRRVLEAPPGDDGCVAIRTESSVDLAPDAFKDVRSSLAAADFVLVGRAVGRRPGYRGGRLGWIVRVLTEEALRGEPLPDFLLFFPTGRIDFQGRSYCLFHDAFPSPPEVGDRILLMHQTQRQGPLIRGLPSQMVILPADGPPVVGRRLGQPEPGTEPSITFSTSAEALGWARAGAQLAD
ncbi:MAG: hypothetical protein AAGM22_08185 [Acidobacteriota bacterium]